MLEIEINSATDNPLVFPDGAVADPDAIATAGGHVVSGGNFHGQPVALAMDFAKLAIAELGSISERRTALLIDGRLSGLPPFLVADAGLNSGLMLLQYTAAALVSEDKVLVHPASADSIPTSANQEDHVSMGSIAARQARADPGQRPARRGARAALRRPGPRLPCRRRPAPRAPGSPRRIAGCAVVSAHLEGDRDPGPDIAAATGAGHRRSVARPAAGPPRREHPFQPLASGA